MKSFNRERFLFMIFAGLLAYQGTLFGFALISCSKRPNPQVTCPEIGERWDKFLETSTAAVLGLIAGSAVASASTKTDSTEKKSAEPLGGMNRVRRVDTPPDRKTE